MLDLQLFFFFQHLYSDIGNPLLFQKQLNFFCFICPSKQHSIFCLCGNNCLDCMYHRDHEGLFNFSSDFIMFAEQFCVELQPNIQDLPFFPNLYCHKVSQILTRKCPATFLESLKTRVNCGVLINKFCFNRYISLLNLCVLL